MKVRGYDRRGFLSDILAAGLATIIGTTVCGPPAAAAGTFLQLRVASAASGLPVSISGASWNATAVWNYQYAGVCGIVSEPNQVVSSGNLPSGASWSTAGGVNYVTFTSSSSISRWDFSGTDVVVQGNGVVLTAANCRFYNAATTNYTVQVGDGSTTSGIVATNCEFTCLTTVANGGGVYVEPTATGSFSFCKWGQGSQLQLIMGGNTSVTDCYFAETGVNAGSGAHIENIRWNAGSTHTVTRTFIDNRASTHSPVSDWTGSAFAGNSANTNITLTNVIMAGVPGAYAAQLTASAVTITASFVSCIIQPGTSGYVADNAFSGGTVSRTGSGNTNYNDGTAAAALNI